MDGLGGRRERELARTAARSRTERAAGSSEIGANPRRRESLTLLAWPVKTDDGQ